MKLLESIEGFVLQTFSGLGYGMLLRPLSDFCDFALDGTDFPMTGQIAANAFFALAGFGEFAGEQGLSDEEFRKFLLSLKPEKGDLETKLANWLSELNLGDGDKSRFLESIEKMDSRTFASVNSWTPHMSLSHAVGVLLCFAEYIADQGIDLDKTGQKVEIRFAGYYVEDYLEVFQFLSRLQRNAVYKAAGQNSVLILEEMAFARPVTKPNAEMIIQALRLTKEDKKSPDGLKALNYRERTQIRKMARELHQRYPDFFEEFKVGTDKDKSFKNGYYKNTTVSSEVIHRELMEITKLPE